MKTHKTDLSRRQALLSGLFGAGFMGLRSLATGLPLAFFLRPNTAMSEETCVAAANAQYLVLSTSGNGDPLNANVPGAYLLPGIAHPLDATMAKTNFKLGAQTVTAALPWSTLPAHLMGQTCFFHHTTLTNNHSNQNKVMRLMGGTKRQEMFSSLYAKNLAACLGTVQHEPITVGANGSGELLSYEGRTLPKLSPSGLKDVLTSPVGPLTNLQKLRDDDLNRLNALFKETGNSAQRGFLDRLAQSQTEVRSLSQALLQGLSEITGDDQNNQVLAAALLIKMKVAPVVSVHLSFGGDNHGDTGLVNEAKFTNASVETIKALFAKLAELGLEDKVTFAAMNVFGRTLSPKGGDLNAPTGRDHLANHHCTLMIGKGLKPSVIGGIMAKGTDFTATGIDSVTGAANPTGGDVPFADTLNAVGKTLGKALGVPDAALQDGITGGIVVPAALA